MNNPAVYLTVNDLHRRDASDFSDEFVDELGEISGRCLDVGSGPGDTAIDFILPKLNKKASLVCSDISEKMVNFAKEKYKDNERVSFIKLDIETPDLPKHLVEHFDHITSFYCLHWCQDMRQAFVNIFNLLRPGGTTFFTLVAEFPPLNAYKILAAMPRYQPYIQDVDRYIPVLQRAEQLLRRETLQVLLKDVGFEIRQCSLRDKAYIFDTPGDVEKFMLAVNPFIERMPAELRVQYGNDLAKEVAKETMIVIKNGNKEKEHSVEHQGLPDGGGVAETELRIDQFGSDQQAEVSFGVDLDMDELNLQTIDSLRWTMRRHRKANCWVIMNDPAFYTTANDLQRRDARDFSDEFSDEFGKMSGRCLDIGSGPGDVAVDVILPKLNTQASLVCSDISEVMLKFAREKYKDNERMSCIKLDIETPDLPKHLVEQFDHVTSFFCLHWCQDMRQVFENIFDLLRPGGSSFLIFIASNQGMNSYKKLEAMPRYQPYMKNNADRYIPVFQHSLEPPKTLQALIEDVGFEVHHCSVREKSYTFVNPDVFSGFVLAINPFIDLIPADLTKDFKKDLVNEFSRECIVFNKNKRNKDEYSILMLAKTFVVYLKKPFANNK